MPSSSCFIAKKNQRAQRRLHIIFRRSKSHEIVFSIPSEQEKDPRSSWTGSLNGSYVRSFAEFRRSLRIIAFRTTAQLASSQLLMEQNHMLPRSVLSETQDPSTGAKAALPSSNHGQLNSNIAQSQPPHSPPAFPHPNDSSLLKFPDVPSTELPPIQPPSAHNQADNTLPSLATLTGSHQPRRFPSQPPDSNSFGHLSANISPWPSLNPLSSYYAPSHAHAAESPARMDVDASSSSAMSAASPDCFHDGRASSVSLDDPDVRLAAEALGDLRAGKLWGGSASE